MIAALANRNDDHFTSSVLQYYEIHPDILIGIKEKSRTNRGLEHFCDNLKDK